MKAVSSASGSVIFVPNENKPNGVEPVSYRDLVEIQRGKEGPKPFGKRREKNKGVENVA